MATDDKTPAPRKPYRAYRGGRRRGQGPLKAKAAGTGAPAPPSPPRPPLPWWQRPAGWGRFRRWLFSLAVLVCALVIAVAGLIHQDGPFFFVSCDISVLQPKEPGVSSFVYSQDGTRFSAIPAPARRLPANLSQISPMLQKATVAIEDRRFYHHGGVDLHSLFRAVFHDIGSGSLSQGGSTIDQQLVKNLYLGDERTLGRKLEEGCLAQQLDRAWSKRRILDAYLNTIYYGEQSYGVEAAAHSYFSKSAAKLSLPQAALLAGLPQAPSDYDPLHSPDAAKERRAEVLQAMLASGEISKAEEQAASRAPLGLKPSASLAHINEPYYVNYLYDQLVARYGARTVRQGGLKIYTTLDWRWQQAAEKIVKKRLYLKSDPATALVAIDPASGAVQSMVSLVPGHPNYQFNLAAQGRRQAGSAFKVFTLTDAVLRGIDPYATTYLSAPFHGPPSDPFLIQTDTHSYAGRISLAEATAQSDNTVFVRLALDLGPKDVAATAHLLGITSPLRAVPTITLGVNPVSPLEMASGYATLAAQGVYHKPYTIVRVQFPNGKVDRWGAPPGRRVIPAAVAYEVTQVLTGVISHGTGTAANIGRPAAGKTGTTSSLADAWFDGYTPQLDAAVWVGYPKARIAMSSVHGIQVFGGTFPAQIWHDFMAQALAARPALDFTKPQGTLTWSRWCGRFQYATGYQDARPRDGCQSSSAPAPSATTTGTTSTTTHTTTSTTTTTVKGTTTPSPAPPTVTHTTTRPRPTTTAPPPTTTQPPPPPPTTTAQTTTPTTTASTTTAP